MKKYLPLILLGLLPQTAEAQVKLEASPRNLDVKSPYFQSFLTNPARLDLYENTQGELKGKFRNNSIYVIRNGLLNHMYGGNLDLGFLNGYGNFTDQSKKTENLQTQQSPLGQITTQTTLKEEKKSNDWGASLNYKDFFVAYDDANSTDAVTGNTLITINENNDLVSFSTASVNSSATYTVGFPYGFAKIIQNQHTSEDGTGKDKTELFDNFLLNGKYSFKIKGKNPAKVSLFHGGDMDSGKGSAGGISGLIGMNIWRDIDANIFYEGKNRKFKAKISTSDYSRLNERDFGRQLENGLRLAPRIYDSPLETTGRYLEDMFFVKPQGSIKILGRDIPFGYNFSIGTDHATASVNLKHVLLHTSPESQAIGLKYRFGIGTYNIKNKEAKLGVFFGKQ